MTPSQLEEANNTLKMMDRNLSSGDDYQTWAVTVMCIILAPVTCLGAVGNVINIKTFLRLGISDGVNMSLISLATSDLLYLISAFGISISLLFQGIEELSMYNIFFPVEPLAVFMVFTHAGSGFYSISMLVTTFITVVRCLAVANPIKYRNLLSWRTTTLIISIFTVLSITSAVLLFVTVDILPQLDHNINTTRPSLGFSKEERIIEIIVFGLRDMFLPLASQTVVSICVIIMARYLQKASKFRKTLLKHPVNNNERRISIIREPLKSVNTKTNDLVSVKAVGKEVQVVQQMFLIAIVYSLCNMPKVIFNLTQIIFPDFNKGERYSSVYVVCNIIRELIQSLNASVAIFIYWKYNSRFRNLFISAN